MLPQIGTSGEACHGVFGENSNSSGSNNNNDKGKNDNSRELEKTLEDLEKLPNIDLEESSLKEGLEKLFDELKDLQPILEELAEVDRQATPDNKSAANEVLERNISKLNEKAKEVLSENPGEGDLRRRAEGLKYLLKASKNIYDRINFSEDKSEEKSDEESKEEGDPSESSESADSSNSTQNSSQQQQSKDQKSDPSKSDSQKSQEDQQKQPGLEEMVEQLKREAENLQNSIEQNHLQEKIKEQLDEQAKQQQEEQKSEQRQDETQDSKQQENKESEQQTGEEQLSQEQREQLEKEYEELKDIVEELKKQLEEKQKEMQEEQREEESSEKQEGENSEESQQGEPQSEEQQSGEQQSGEQQGGQQKGEQQQGQPQQGQKGEPASYEELKNSTQDLKQQLEEMKQQIEEMAQQKQEKDSKEGEKSEGEGEGEGEGESGEGKPGEGKPGEGEPKEGEPGEGEPGKESGKGSEDMEIHDKLMDDLKDLFNFEEKLDEKSEKESKEEMELGEDKLSLDDLLKELKQEEDKLKEELKDEQPLENLNFDQQKQELPNLNKETHEHAIKKTIEMLWVKTLRQYHSSNELMSGISSFRNYIEKVAGLSNADMYFKQMIKMTREMYQDLDHLNLNYTKLDDFAHTHFTGSENGEALRKVRYFKKLLTTIKQYDSLTKAEAELLALVSSLDVRLSDMDVSDKSFVDAFINQVKGPLSQKVIREEYTSEDGQINYTELAKDIKKGELNDLLVYSAIRQYAEIFHHQKKNPNDSTENSGYKEVINESEPDLMITDEISNYQRFYKDGSPLEVELARLVSGDMLEYIYREAVPKRSPKDPIIKRASIVLYDISGSMSGTKQTLRNSLINTYLDRTFTEVAQGKEEHTVYLIPFDTQVRGVEKVTSLREANEYFDRMRKAPVSSGGGTTITNALVEAYEMISKHQKESGELDRANVLLITDGQDSVNLPQVKESQAKVDEKTQVYLNAIMIEQSNYDINKLVEEQNKDLPSPRSSSTHINMGDLHNLLDEKQHQDRLTESAKAYSTDLDEKVDHSVMVEFKNRIYGLAHEEHEKDFATPEQHHELLGALQPLGDPKGHRQINVLFEILKEVTKSKSFERMSSRQRSEVVIEFAEIVSRDYKVDKEQVILNLSNQLKSFFKSWIENK